MEDQNRLIYRVNDQLRKNKDVSKQDISDLLKIAKKYVQDINYTRCSELLKSKEKLSYNLWKLVKGYETYNNKVLKKGNDFVDIYQLMQEYEDYEQSFLIV